MSVLHYAFVEDVNHLPGRTACGLIAAVEGDRWDMTNATFEWITGPDVSAVTCLECLVEIEVDG